MRQMLLFGAILSAIGIAVALTIHWFPPSASTQAKPVDRLWYVLLIVSTPIFALVVTVVLFSIWKFRMRPGEELLDGPPIHGNTRLEIIWTAVPALLLVGLCTYAYLVLTDIEKAKANTMKVRVVGEQFAWTYYYPGQGSGGHDLVTRELYLPVNQNVDFTIQAKDVLHDFWVPAFRIKKDAVPGISTAYRITTTRVGTYPVVCAELCGLGHSVMRSTVHVMPRGAFQQWLTRMKAGKQAGAGGAGAAAGGQAGAGSGKQVFLSSGCTGCHTLADAGSSGTVGPNLDQGLKGKTAAFIRQSIVTPNAVITKGFPAGVMPQNFGKTIPPAQLDALVKYLSSVTKGG